MPNLIGKSYRGDYSHSLYFAFNWDRFGWTINDSGLKFRCDALLTMALFEWLAHIYSHVLPLFSEGLRYFFSIIFLVSDM